MWANTDPIPRFSCFKDLVETIIETGTDLNLFATTVWAIWNRRNTMRTSQKHVPMQQVHYEVQKTRSAFIRASQPRPPEQMPHFVSRSIWKPPPWPKFKVNFDGAVFREIQRAGLGVIVRDSEGRVCASMEESLHLPFSIAAVEVLAAKKAIQFAKDLGFHSIILEGDSKIAINGLLRNNSTLTEYGHLLNEAKEVAAQMNAVEF